MVSRPDLVRAVGDRLGNRALVWAGLRGTDIESLVDLPNLEASVSIIGAYDRRSSIESMAYEDLSGTRPDLELWDIDFHLDAAASQLFRERLLKLLRQPSALLPYRPSRFLSSISFARRSTAWNLGLFGAHQAGFDHKPWVESSLQDEKVPAIDWRYIADEERVQVVDLLDDGPVVLRRSRTSGGQGIIRVDDASQLEASWPYGPEGFVSVAPFLDPTVPLNVGGTVWHDGVTVHYPSVQLIGIDSCVSRPFGYCGNDFAAIKAFDRTIIDQIEHHTEAIGRWLGRHGYRGSFGVDYLLHEGEVLFTEINPRFQGSTCASAQLSVAAGMPCLYLEHLAAMLDLDAPDQPPLRQLVADAGDRAHVVVHWLGAGPAEVDAQALRGALVELDEIVDIDLVAPRGVVVDPGATVLRATANKQLTTDGFVLDDPYRRIVSGWQRNAAPDR